MPPRHLTKIRQPGKNKKIRGENGQMAPRTKNGRKDGMTKIEKGTKLTQNETRVESENGGETRRERNTRRSHQVEVAELAFSYSMLILEAVFYAKKSESFQK